MHWLAGVSLLFLAAGQAGGQPGEMRRGSRAAPQVEPAPAANPEDYATVEGNVYDLVTGAPLAKAQILMYRTGGPGGQQLGATTDSAGHFVIRNLEPGQYRLSARRNRYAMQWFGQKTAGERGNGAPVTLTARQHLKDVQFRLSPAAVVVGRVLDEEGEPLAYVQVAGMSYRYIQGRKELIPLAGMVVTNDLGEYRMFDVPPGKYYIAATYRERYGFGGGRGPAEESDSTFPTVYYPGVLDPGQTAPVELRGGEERSGIDFRLVRSQSVRVRGKVVLAGGGLPPRGTAVNAMPAGGSYSVMAARQFASVDARTGEFDIGGVLPGSYVLTAMSQAGRERLFGSLPIDVGGSNVENLVVPLSPGVTLPGVIRLEENAPAGTSLESVRVGLMGSVPMLGGGGSSVSGDGTFEIERVAPGSYRLRIMALPEGAFVKEARYRDADALERGLEIGAGPAGLLEIVVSPKAGLLTGAVFDGKKKPAAGAMVVAVPEEPARRVRQDLVLTSTADQYGRFVLSSIPPGSYKVFAFEGVDPGAYQDPVFWEPYEDEGEKLKVEESSSAVLELEVIQAAQPEA